jgi:hypothetical protein
MNGSSSNFSFLNDTSNLTIFWLAATDKDDAVYPLNPFSSWEPSQTGFFLDPPQRQRVK